MSTIDDVSVNDSAPSSSSSKPPSQATSESQTQSPSNGATAARHGGRFGKLNPLATTAVVLLVVVLVGTIWWIQSAGHEETDDAYVEGHISYVSSRISGTVTRVLVNEHQRVDSGQLLVTLDPHDEQAKLDEDTALLEQAKLQADAAKSKIRQTELSAAGETTQARGDISSTEADIISARAAVTQASHEVTEARARLKELQAQEQFAKTDFERYKVVYANRAVTKQQYDKAMQSLEVATAQREQAEQNVSQALQQEAMTRSKVVEAIGRMNKSKGMLTSAEAMTAQKDVAEADYLGAVASTKHFAASLEQAKLQLSYTHIQAPVAGRVGKKSVEVGQRVEPGQSLMSVVQDDTWIIANYKETQLGKMKPGQAVEITIDTFPGQKFKGKIESVGPASGAKFSVLPAENATGNFTKIVQRLPVKIVFDPDSVKDYKTRIAPGMSCIVSVDTK